MQKAKNKVRAQNGATGTTQSSSKQLDLIFHALADSTRREILNLITSESLMVTEIAGKFEMSLNAVSKHLKILEAAGFLTRKTTGRVHMCRLNPKPFDSVKEVVAFYSRFWESQLQGLEDYLNAQQTKNDL
jgi:DNA-binding transcriptional ArsR family regulator